MKMRVFGMVVVVIATFSYGFVKNVSAWEPSGACTALVPTGMTLSDEAQKKVAAEPDPHRRELIKKGLLIEEALKRGLLKPKPRFIQWIEFCEAFNPDTGEFEDLPLNNAGCTA